MTEWILLLQHKKVKIKDTIESICGVLVLVQSCPLDVAHHSGKDLGENFASNARVFMNE